MGAKAGLLAVAGGKLPFLIVSPRLALCGGRARHPLQDEERRRRGAGRGTANGSSAWNSCRWLCSHADILYYLENGFQTGFSSTLYMCHLFTKNICTQGRAEGLTPPPRVRDTRPKGKTEKGSSIEGVIRIWVPRRGLCQQAQEVQVRSERPQACKNCPGGPPPKAPLCDRDPYAPRGSRAPSNAVGQFKGARTPVARCGGPKKTASRTATKMQAPQKFGLESAESALPSRAPQRFGGLAGGGSIFVLAAAARASAPIKAPAPPSSRVLKQRASPARRPRRTSYFGVAALFSNSSSP